MPLPILPNPILHRILDFSDPPTQDAALSASKNMLAVTNEVRRMQASRLATMPGRFTQEIVPTRTELARMGVPDPRMQGVFNAMREDPTAPVAPGSYLAHVKAHADFQKAQRDARKYGGLQRRENPEHVDVGEVNAQQQSHGFCTRTHANPRYATYEGAMVRGLLHGFGYARYPNGETHEGLYAAGFRNGPGTTFANNGQLTSGTFQNNRLHGPVVTTLRDGTHIEDEYVDGVPHGRRVATEPRGNRSEIRMEHGHPVDGRISNANGTRYEGAVNGLMLPHGHGTMTSASGNDYYEGAWVNGRRQGNGTHRLASGAFYTGMFEADRPHGQGTVFLPNGRRIEDVFVHGRAPATITPQTSAVAGNTANSANGKRSAPDSGSQAQTDSRRQRSDD